MSYQTIATKYRPKTFKDLLGQEPTVLALKGSMTQSRIPSGVIFSGTRGVGKTSLARIYAKALNCEGELLPEPCGVCLSCKAISEGHHEDVVEIDGASNNGVDEVRALKESTVYVPQRSRYRIYIIDEVHMLSVSAFNALLKTLEEPPPHVVFLFATTEIAKLPQTVVSRCQTFRLQKISLKDMAARIEFILEREGITWEEGLLPILAREGRGSLRDALTFLDQLIAISGAHLTKASLEKILGTLSQASYISLLESLLQKKAQSCLEQIEQLDEKAENFVKIVTRLAILSRNVFVIKAFASSELKKDFADLEEDDLSRLKALAKVSKSSEVNKLFRALSSCLDDLRDSFLDRYIFENLCLELCFSQPKENVQVKPSAEAALSQGLVQKKEEKVIEKEKEGVSPFKKEAPAENKIEQNEAPFQNDGSFPPSWKDLVARWKQIKPLQARKLEDIIPHEYSRERITLLVDENSLVGPTLLKSETRKKVALVLAKLFGFKGELIVKSGAASEGKEIEPGYSNVAPPKESLLEEKERLQGEKEKETLRGLQEHKLTQGLCDKFSGTVVETYVNGSRVAHD